MHGQVAHEIGRRIVAGDLRESILLPREAELSEAYHVSRQAVREALKVLAAKGLITTRRRTGSLVAPRRHWNLLDPDVLAWHARTGVSIEFLRDLVEFRVMIEPEAAALAAARASAEQLVRIAAAVEGMRDNTTDTDRFYVADLAFHIAVFAASDNSLIDRLSTIMAPLLQANFRIERTAPVDYRRTVERHERIYAAIARHDPTAARAAMRDVLAVNIGEVEAISRQSGAASGLRLVGYDDVDSDGPDETGAVGDLYPSRALHGRVVHTIGRQIVTGAIHEGQTLPREADLAEQYQVSRQAIREALKVLAAKGLVSTRRRAGTAVASRSDWNLLDSDIIAWHHPRDLPVDFLTDLIELRLLVEPAAAALAAERRDSAQMKRIATAMTDMRRTASDPDWMAADVEFHVAIAVASGNTLIERLSRILAPLLEASMKGQGNLAPSLEVAIDVHAAIEAGIAARDPERARKAMEAMLRLTDSRLRLIMGGGTRLRA